MNALLTQKKMFVIATCIFLISMSTILFLVGENQLVIESEHIKAHVLEAQHIEEPQNEEFYRELLGNLEDDIVILNKDNTIHYSTESWREKHEYVKEEINGELFFTFVHPKDLPFFANELVEIMNTGEEKSNIGPFRVLQKSGQYTLNMATVTPLRDSEDKIVELALGLRDVSVPVGQEDDLEELVSFLE